MKHIKTFSELFNENDFQVIVFNFLPFLNESVEQLYESKWVESSIEKGIWLRVERHNMEMYHAHVAREKHKNTKDKQVAWNENGTKHDKKSFNQNFHGLERAKNAVRQALNIPSNVILEYVDSV